MKVACLLRLAYDILITMIKRYYMPGHFFVGRGVCITSIELRSTCDWTYTRAATQKRSTKRTCRLRLG
ncbi:hypothetical protein J6590_025442 [Homalodisca vitripennis]|nr:hypothetical protein J6590_025442 [Homalodisca vitripennis]